MLNKHRRTTTIYGYDKEIVLLAVKRLEGQGWVAVDSLKVSGGVDSLTTYEQKMVRTTYSRPVDD